MQKKRILCTSVALLAAISLIMPNQGYTKAKKPVLSKKKLTMSVGESKTLKVKNTKKTKKQDRLMMMEIWKNLWN